MYVDIIPNRDSPPAVLLRETWRENGKICKRTVANISDWPMDKVEALRAVLRSEGGLDVVPKGEAPMEVVRSLPYGHVAVVLGAMRRLGMEEVVGMDGPVGKRVQAMIAARILDPQSKLATAQSLGEESGWLQTLGQDLGLEDAVDEDALYAAMDALVLRQSAIEQTLVRQHLQDGSLVLYDLTSTYFHGHHCPLAKLGYSRDGKRGLLQITIGLLCTSAGCPVAVEVFPGNSGDPKTFSAQVAKVRERFGLKRVVYVGDRGMITNVRIREDLAGDPELGWVTCLRAPAIQELREQGAIQLSLFDHQDLAEITSEDYPGERLVVCRNPLLAVERQRTRQELLDATEEDLKEIATRISRAKRPLRGAALIGRAVEPALIRHKVGKHFIVTITDDACTWVRDEERIRREAELDGFYVIRAKVPEPQPTADELVATYKGLSTVERAFRTLKGVDLKIRPIHHRLEARVRAHVLLCMLAYYVEFHLRAWLAPILFQDDEPEAGEALRENIVQPAQRSPKAKEKAKTKRTVDDLPVHSFPSLLRDLATITKNTLRPTFRGALPFTKVTLPTVFQRRAFELIQVSPP
jgi:transposase